jgi:hypothetical protein
MPHRTGRSSSIEDSPSYITFKIEEVKQFYQDVLREGDWLIEHQKRLLLKKKEEEQENGISE